MVKLCSVQKTSREVELFSPGNGTSVTRAHVHDLYTRHAHTENWGELYEQLHVHNVLSRHHFYTATKIFSPTFFFLNHVQENSLSFLLILTTPRFIHGGKTAKFETEGRSAANPLLQHYFICVVYQFYLKMIQEAFQSFLSSPIQ